MLNIILPVLLAGVESSGVFLQNPDVYRAVVARSAAFQLEAEARDMEQRRRTEEWEREQRILEPLVQQAIDKSMNVKIELKTPEQVLKEVREEIERVKKRGRPDKK